MDCLRIPLDNKPDSGCKWTFSRFSVCEMGCLWQFYNLAMLTAGGPLCFIAWKEVWRSVCWISENQIIILVIVAEGITGVGCTTAVQVLACARRARA